MRLKKFTSNPYFEAKSQQKFAFTADFALRALNANSWEPIDLALLASILGHFSRLQIILEALKE